MTRFEIAKTNSAHYSDTAPKPIDGGRESCPKNGQPCKSVECSPTFCYVQSGPTDAAASSTENLPAPGANPEAGAPSERLLQTAIGERVLVLA
jgi:hypothetical protein